VQTNDALAQRSRDELIAQLLESERAAIRARQEMEREREQRRTLEQQLRWFKRQLFGPRSERRLLEADPTQLCLGEGLGTEARREAPETATTVRRHVRRRRPPRQGPDEKGLRFDDSVPVVTVEVPNPELEGVPAEDQEGIGEKVSYRLGQRPAAYLVAKIVRKVVKRKDTGQITTAPLPLAVLEKSYADVSLLAGLLVDKFRYHLPLYRQHQRMQAAGVSVARASLTSWAAQAVELLEPIYEAQLDSIRESSVLAMDETPIRAGRRAPGRMKTGQFWPLYGDRDEVVFPYAPTRSRRVVEELLEGFSGTLLSDGFEAYERFAAQRERVTHALCWAHTRRKFVEAEDVEPERARRALEAIRQLYDQEERIRAQGLEGIAKIQARAQGSRPVLEGLFRWLEEELTQGALLPTNPFTRAALYALKRRAGLAVFLADPAVPIDTNHLERALRPIPMGKKNWLFCWSELGARQVGHVQSLIATCVLQGVDPYVYLVDVLQRVAVHPQARVEELTPRRWKEHFAQAPLSSWID